MLVLKSLARDAEEVPQGRQTKVDGCACVTSASVSKPCADTGTGGGGGGCMCAHGLL